MKPKLILFISCLLLQFSFSSLRVSAQADLPIHLFPKAGHKTMLLYLTGDGGMNSFSRSLIKTLNDQGYAVIALDTRKYFWEKKEPAQFARDTRHIIDQYLKSWNKNDFALLGYSFGADVGAFVPPLLPVSTASQLKAVVLLSPGFSTGFVTKISNMLGMGGTDKDPYKVYPQLSKSPAPVLCVFGAAENSDFYPAIKPTAKLRKVLVPGSHKYNDDVNLVAKTIIQAL
jgi:type IV secretory pathway VirJ component